MRKKRSSKQSSSISRLTVMMMMTGMCCLLSATSCSLFLVCFLAFVADFHVCLLLFVEIFIQTIIFRFSPFFGQKTATSVSGCLARDRGLFCALHCAQLLFLYLFSILIHLILCCLAGFVSVRLFSPCFLVLYPCWPTPNPVSLRKPNIYPIFLHHSLS